MTPRPAAPGDPGWPRPRHRAAPVRPSEALGTDPSTWAMRPVPWIAQTNLWGGEQYWNPAAYDSDRATAMIVNDLCQVCGGPRGDTVYVLENDDDELPISMSGGALCSLRCARLTAAVCPHYRKRWPVRVLAVAHPGPRTAFDNERALDDAVPMTGPREFVATIGEQP